MSEEPIAISDGVFEIDGELYTLSLDPGTSVYGEEMLNIEDVEYRRWDPDRSKLGAFLEEEGGLPFRHDTEVLYLGAGDGTTVSHLSDIITDGKIYAVEVAKNPYRNLLDLSKKRKNIFPIMADARKPEDYRDIVGKVDLVYQDIAQRDQVKIFLRNLFFLEEEGIGMISVKARSIDVSSSPKKIFEEVESELEKEEISVLSRVDISSRQKDHTVLVIEK